MKGLQQGSWINPEINACTVGKTIKSDFKKTIPFDTLINKLENTTLYLK